MPPRASSLTRTSRARETFSTGASPGPSAGANAVDFPTGEPSGVGAAAAGINPWRRLGEGGVVDLVPDLAPGPLDLARALGQELLQRELHGARGDLERARQLLGLAGAPAGEQAQHARDRRLHAARIGDRERTHHTQPEALVVT